MKSAKLLSTRANSVLVNHLVPSGHATFGMPDDELLRIVKTEVQAKYKRKEVYIAMLRFKHCGKKTAREICLALGYPPRAPKYVPPKPKPKAKLAPPAPPQRELTLSANARKVLTEFMVGRTGVRYGADDRHLLTAAGACEPHIADRDLLQVRGCGRRVLREIRAAIVPYLGLPQYVPEYNNFEITFRIAAVRAAERYMVVALRRSLDNLLACYPMNNMLIVVGAALTKGGP
jgi:hypothetical protein